MNKVIDFSLKKGKIFIADINTYNEIDADLYIYCTTFPNEIPPGTIHSDQLAPSYDLYIQKNAWIDKGELGVKFNIYKERYLKELKAEEDSVKAIDKLKEFVSKGLDIVIFDDCNLGKHCHTYILSLYLKELGFRVIKHPSSTGGR